LPTVRDDYLDVSSVLPQGRKRFHNQAMEFTHMNLRISHRTATAILITALLPWPAAFAQVGDLLKQGTGSGSSSALGGLGGLGDAVSGQSMTSGSAGNVAGLLEFCINNNYLSADKAASVKNSLMGKLPGGSSSDSGYKSGSKGILSSSDGGQLDLSGGGLKKQVTKQICDQVLDQGKSLL
jgi:hypothetical protein